VEIIERNSKNHEKPVFVKLFMVFISCGTAMGLKNKGSISIFGVTRKIEYMIITSGRNQTVLVGKYL
jgi:hypothetical protein